VFNNAPKTLNHKVNLDAFWESSAFSKMSNEAIESQDKTNKSTLKKKKEP
jgi:hypothetical protein